MKQSKPKDLRGLTAEDLKKKVVEARESLFKLKIRKATRQLEDSSGLRALKRDIARFETLVREKAAAPKAVPAKQTAKA